MATKIMHVRIPKLENTKTTVRDQFLMSPELASKYAALIKESLKKQSGDDWVVLVTPFDDIKIFEV